MRQVEKVYAYITQEDRLLVFTHIDFPEAGIQVPGGTLEDGETPGAAVLREASEETGLHDFVMNAYLGSDEFLDDSTAPNQIVNPHFFHLVFPFAVPETWQHYEQHPSEGSPEPILFEFYWLPLREADRKVDQYFTARLGRLKELLSGGYRQAHRKGL